MTKAKKKAKRNLPAIAKPKQPESLLQVITKAASDPKLDVAKLQALLDMRHSEEARQAEIIFNNALADAIEALPPIAKDAKGDRNIKYASLIKVSNALDPIMRRHNLQLSFTMADSKEPEVYRIVGELRHRAGYKREYFIDVPQSITGPKGAPIMTKAQGSGAAISFGRRYLKLMIFDIRIIGEADAAVSEEPEALDMEAVMALQKLMTKARANTEKFCEYFAIAAVPELPKQRLPEAERILNRMIRELDGAA